MAKPKGYSTLQIGLHWAIALLIIAAWFTHEDMGDVLRARVEAGTTGIEGNTLHVWFGGAAFTLILVRIVVRLIRGAPDHLPETSPAMARAAEWGHRMIYLLMVLVPAFGAAAWYGHILPAGETHEVLGKTLMVLALGHAAIALYHHYRLKDGTLRRMLRPGG